MDRQREQHPDIPVPVAIFRMISYVSNEGTKEEGIFRLAGVHTRMKQIKDMLNAGTLRIRYVSGDGGGGGGGGGGSSACC
jgi:hypothetical protein